MSAPDQHAAGVPLQAWRLGGGSRCGIHGDDTTGGRCGSCDQVAYDQAQAHLERQAEEAADRADYEADRGEDAEARWYALNDGWVQ